MPKHSNHKHDQYENESKVKVRYCPYCGEGVYSSYSDGTYQCESCGRRFGVTDVE